MKIIIALIFSLMLTACSGTTGGTYKNYETQLSSYVLNQGKYLCCEPVHISIRTSGSADVALIIKRPKTSQYNNLSMYLADNDIEKFITYLSSQLELEQINPKNSTRIKLSNGKWHSGATLVDGTQVTHFIGNAGYIGFSKNEIPKIINKINKLKAKVVPNK